MRLLLCLLLATFCALNHAAAVKQTANVGSLQTVHVQSDSTPTMPTVFDTSSSISSENFLQTVHVNSQTNHIETSSAIDERSHQTKKQLPTFHAQNQLRTDTALLQDLNDGQNPSHMPQDRNLALGVTNFQSALPDAFEDSSLQQPRNNGQLHQRNQQHFYSIEQQVPQEQFYQSAAPDQQFSNTEQQMHNQQFYNNGRQFAIQQFSNDRHQVPNQQSMSDNQQSTPVQRQLHRNVQEVPNRVRFYNDNDKSLSMSNEPAHNQLLNFEQRSHELSGQHQRPEHVQFYDADRQVQNQRQFYNEMVKEEPRNRISRRFPKVSDIVHSGKDKHHLSKVQSQTAPNPSAFNNREHPLVLPRSSAVQSRSVIVSGLKNLPVLPALVYNGGVLPSPHSMAYSSDSWYHGGASVRQHLQTPFVRYVYGHVL